MKKILLLQLPVPQLNYQKQSGNVPLAPAYLKQALATFKDLEVEIVPESISSYYADQALIAYIIERKADLIGFTVYCWNIHRSFYIHKKLKEAQNFISVAGGPEITPDNYLLLNHNFDHVIYGEGEISFCGLIAKLTGRNVPNFSLENLVSPYLLGYMENYIEKTMFLETQRGCPYKCGFCYYNKSREKIIQFPVNKVLEAIRYAYEDKDINQIYLMDPSLNTRSQLEVLISEIKNINKHQKLSFYSEIRAEFVTNEWAQLFSEAGFKEFEVGLQSTNHKALDYMNRPTDLDKFVRGCNALKLFDIVPKIDLIVGLPGDTPDGFKKSVDFVYEHALDDYMQVFALSVLSGTDYRKKSSFYSLEYQQDPPYYVQKTATFNWEDIFNSFKYAEKIYGINLFPQALLDFSYKSINLNHSDNYSKLYLKDSLSETQLCYLAKKLANPYQIICEPKAQSLVFLKKMINVFTENNPFTSFELVLFDPKLNNLNTLLKSFCKLSIHAFLDNDLEYASALDSPKSFLISIISDLKIKKYTDYNIRQIYHWQEDSLPDLKDLYKFQNIDGIFIDNSLEIDQVLNWQKDFALRLNLACNQDLLEQYEFMPEYFFSFADNIAQENWMKLFSENEFCFEIKHNIFKN